MADETTPLPSDLRLSPADQLDIVSMLTANAGQLDLDWIRGECQAVCTADDPRLTWFEEQLRQTEPPHAGE